MWGDLCKVQIMLYMIRIIIVIQDSDCGTQSESVIYVIHESNYISLTCLELSDS